MSSPVSATPGEGSRLRRRVLEELKAIRARIAALEQLLDPPPPAAAPRPAAPVNGHRWRDQSPASPAPRGRGPARRRPAAAPSAAIEFHAPCASCAPYCAFPNCPCTCHRAATAGRP